MAIKTRQTTATGVTNNNAPLTNAELDNNFVELQQNKVDASGDTMTGNLSFGDDDKAIFGDGSDLQIYHDGQNSYIDDTATGYLHLRGDSRVKIGSVISGETMASFIADGEVQLFHNNVQKFATKSTGIDVTGEVKADKFVNDESLPDVRPSLLLDFANQKALDPRITFTRGSTATYWDGKTTAKAEENLTTYSQDYTKTVTAGTGRWSIMDASTTTGITAPDGTSTATQFTEGSAASEYHGLKYTNNTSWITNTEYSLSVYLKNGDRDYVTVVLHGASNNYASVEANLSNGTISRTSASGFTVDKYAITAVGNSWYRVTLTATTNTSVSQPWAYIAGSDGTTAVAGRGMVPYNGDGSSTFSVWGVQIEQRDNTTAYTATTNNPIVKYQPVLQAATVDEARFDHDPATGESKGLLIEESRTNGVSASATLNTSLAIQNATWRTDSVIAPDGTQTADVLVPSADNSFHRGYAGLTTASTNTISVFAKAQGYNFLRMAQWNASTGLNDWYADFNLSSGTATGGGGSYYTSASIEDVGNGWYRCSVSGSYNAANGIVLNVCNTLGGTYFVGDTFSGVALWGLQYEAGSFPTSYIPTSGSTATRALDSAYMDITAGTFGDELTVYAEVDDAPKGYFPRIISLRDTTSNAGPFDFYTSSGSAIGNDSITARIYGFGAVRADPSLSYLSRKLAAAYDVTGLSAMSDANTTVQTDSSIVFPQANRIYIGAYSTTQGLPNVGIKKLALYPKKLSDATITAMTEE